MNTDKHKAAYKIVEYIDGFQHYYNVYYKTKFLWWTFWVSVKDCDMAKTFYTYRDAEDYIERAKKPLVTKTTYYL